MKTKAIIFALLCFVFSSYNYRKKMDGSTSGVIFDTASYIQKQYGLQAGGFGGGARNGVAHLSLDFLVSKDLTAEEAKRLLVICVEAFLNNINSDKALRPLLVEYPFPPSRISLSLLIESGKKDHEVAPGDLLSCSLYSGTVVCATLRERTSFITVDKEIYYKETYEKAKRIVDNEKEY